MKMTTLSFAKLRTSLKLAGLAALTLAVSACELRREGEEVPDTSLDPAEENGSLLDKPLLDEPLLEGGRLLDGSGDDGEVVADEAEPPSISIIREDVVPEAVRKSSLVPLDLVVPFPDGGTDLGDAAIRALNDVLDSEQIAEDWPIVLRGHTDSAGNDRANLRASRARAEAVAVWLVQRGIADERVEVVAMGEQNPAEPNALPDGTANAAGRAKNRRVEVVIAPPAKQPRDDAAASEPSVGQ